MLFKVDITGKTAAELQHATLSALQLKERYDLQEWILQTPRILGEDLLVITSEFSEFDRTSERLDVLALDRRGVLTIVELKRSAVGTAAELQALRYAAYCSTMSLRDISELLAKYESKRTGLEVISTEAERRIKEFVNEPDFTELTNKPRVILGAEEFSPETTATVLWLKTFGLDLSCVRLRPYNVEGQLLLDSSVIIPLPEAKEFQIRRDIKDAEQVLQQPREVRTPEQFLATVSDEVRPVLEHLRNWLLTRPGVREEVFKSLLSYRQESDRAWVTWLQFTRWEARVAIPPAVEADPTLLVRKSPSGWQILRARTLDEAREIESLLGNEPSSSAAAVSIEL